MEFFSYYFFLFLFVSVIFVCIAAVLNCFYSHYLFRIFVFMCQYSSCIISFFENILIPAVLIRISFCLAPVDFYIFEFMIPKSKYFSWKLKRHFFSKKIKIHQLDWSWESLGYSLRPIFGRKIISYSQMYRKNKLS